MSTLHKRSILFGLSSFDQNNLELFLPYHNDTGGYCQPLKSVVESFMNGEEEYMQTSFQTTGNEGMMRDDSHKFCRGLKVEGRNGKVFNCSTTVLANFGLVNNCRIRFTKSHQEIREVFQQLRLVQENDGVHELLRFIGDNPSADRKEMERLFPSLLKNVVPYRPVPQNLPGASVNLNNIVLLGTKEEANTVGACLIELLDETYSDAGAGTVFVGGNMEWNAFDSSSSLSQCLIISFPRQKIYILHLTHMGVVAQGQFPTEMMTFLEDQHIRFCGSNNIGGDLKRLADLGVNIQNRLDTVALSKIKYGDAPHHGLDAVAGRLLQVYVDKEVRTTADWSIFPPASELLQYMGLDGYLSLICATKMFQKYSQHQQQQKYLLMALAMEKRSKLCPIEKWLRKGS